MRISELNDAQREAVLQTEGPVLVLAGAGSGKTRVITYRIAHLLAGGVAPGEILAVTFTNKAADEMRERVDALVGRGAARETTLSTFHSLGVRILRAEAKVQGAGAFTIYDAADALGCIRELLRHLRVTDRRFDVKAIAYRISLWKNQLVPPDRPPEPRDEYDELAGLLYPRYEEQLRAFRAHDFDDLVAEPVRLFERDPEALARWQARYRYLLIDEYQDTNRAQLLCAKYLAGERRNLCAVGDDDQSIYAWRGAEPSNILEFSRHFPGARLVKLEENYRSTTPILASANAVIANNAKAGRHDKVLFTRRAAPEGAERVVCVRAADADEEAAFVCEEIEALRLRHRYALGDFAVLYRSNLQSRAFEEAMRERGLRFRMVGGTQFYERKEVKDVIAYLKVITNPKDEISLRRVINYPARGIGPKALEEAERLANQARQPLLAGLERIGGGGDDVAPARTRAAVRGFLELLAPFRAAFATGSGYARAARGLVEAIGLEKDLYDGAASPEQARRRWDNVEDLLGALSDHEQKTHGAGRGLGGWLARVALDTSADEDEEGPSDAITLATLHGAKGLEWPVVFLVGLEENLLPHARVLYPKGPDVDGILDVGEERRLCYVGITRARERLYLLHAMLRTRRGRAEPRTPSRFLTELPPELLEERSPRGPRDATTEAAVIADCEAQLRALLES